jgi:hypothetical protein
MTSKIKEPKLELTQNHLNEPSPYALKEPRSYMRFGNRLLRCLATWQRDAKFDFCVITWGIRAGFEEG